jgi:hypothetical protein
MATTRQRQLKLEILGLLARPSLSIGARLAVRTRLEVLDPFLGHTSQIYREPAPKLFGGTAQQLYEDLRNQGLRIWNQIKQVALLEDQKATGDYPETERLLADLRQLNEEYLALVLPRIEELLVPADKRRVQTIAASSVSPAVTRYEIGSGDHSYHSIQ